MKLSINYFLKSLLIFLGVLSFSINAFAEGKSESIGSHNNGCLLYGEELPKDGDSYKLPRASRDNNYGSPELVELLEDYAYRVNEITGKELLIGDLSKNNGGPAFIRHSSHQTGLDADIWYSLYDSKNQNLTEQDIENLQPIKMVSDDGKMSDKWGASNEDVLKTFSQNDKVDRIFVNYNIKKHFCEKYKNEDWQRKIRPWWGHDEHFHVRLKCPKDSPDCTLKGAVIKDDGCGSDLAWWFSDEAKLPKSKKEAEAKITEEQILKMLPDRCQEVLKDDLKEE